MADRTTSRRSSTASKKRSSRAAASKKGALTTSSHGMVDPSRIGTPEDDALAGAVFTDALGIEVLTDTQVVLLNVPGSERCSQDFKDKVIQIATRLDTNPNFLMAVMSFESGLNPKARNRVSNATGLIQFMPATAKALKTTIDLLAAMSGEQQLDVVEVYFRPYKGKLKTIEDTYMAVLWPKAVGKGNDYVLFSKPSKAYDQNKGLDIDNDGKVTKYDASYRVRKILTEAGGSSGEILRRGAEGPEVEKLQDALVDLGHLRADEKATGPGIFGARTERSVKEFQVDNFLEENGTYDAATRAAIAQLQSGVRKGSTGTVVRGLQERLVKLGNMTNQQVATGPGIFGPQTEAALVLFQQQHGITSLGILTTETYRALLRTVPTVLPEGGGTNVDTVLPERGRGYRTYNREAGGVDQYGRASSIRAIQDLAEAWADRHPDIFIYVGDISRRGGGPFSPHSSHRDGREIDMRPFRHGGAEGPTNIHSADYDHSLTRELIELIRAKFPGVKILFNDPVLVKDKLTQKFSGHDNHIHVKLP